MIKKIYDVVSPLGIIEDASGSPAFWAIVIAILLIIAATIALIIINKKKKK